MTVPELEECLAHVKRTYPMGRIRGTGRPRVRTVWTGNNNRGRAPGGTGNPGDFKGGSDVVYNLQET